MTSSTVPDLATVEAYHAAVIAAMEPDALAFYGRLAGPAALHRALAHRALDGLRRHQPERTTCLRCHTHNPSGTWVPWPCPDALTWWFVLTAIGTTYGVTE